MLRSRKLLKILSFVAGVGLFLPGATWMLIASSGAIKTGQAAGYIAGTGFLLAASPFLTFPFSARVAKFPGVLTLFALASGMLWLAFRPGLPVDRPLPAQVAAIAFGVLLLARVGLALRRNYSGLGT